MNFSRKNGGQILTTQMAKRAHLATWPFSKGKTGHMAKCRAFLTWLDESLLAGGLRGQRSQRRKVMSNCRSRMLIGPNRCNPTRK
jgi:hypothetical protein